jgi:transposase
MSILTPLLPCQSNLYFDKVQFDDESNKVLLRLTSKQVRATCPCCNVVSHSIHSNYERKLADLPWSTWHVRIRLGVRKFRCLNPACQRKIFCERLSSVVAPWGRRTLRLTKQQSQLGLALGGAAGERLSHHLFSPLSRNTLLRQVRAVPLSPLITPRVLGVDDWAKRKGQHYGTILVDLEKRRPLGLLHDREATTLSTWLQAHPGIEVIARDRARYYADGIAEGAPQAQQVADRFHLLENLARVLQTILERHRKHLSVEQKEASLPAIGDGSVSINDVDNVEPIAEVSATMLVPGLPTLKSRERRAKRIERYTEIHQLYKKGWTKSAIARHLKIDRRAVRYALQSDEFPEFRRKAKKLDPFKPYLLKRWNEGCRTSSILLEEIKQLGFKGERTIVMIYLQRLRQAQGLPPRSRNFTPGVPIQDVAVRTATPAQVTWQILRKPEELTDDDKLLTARLLDTNDDLAEAITLTQHFALMVRERLVEQLDLWLERAKTSSLAAFKRFAKSLQTDYAAVKAALTEPWSTGPVEGHINRLKMLKRQMYGRANLDLLEKRFLYAA